MNPSHYPSIELCRKLTEIGFPKTQYRTDGTTIIEDNFAFDYSKWDACPSVMEMIIYMKANNISNKGIPVDEFMPTYLANRIINNKI